MWILWNGARSGTRNEYIFFSFRFCSSSLFVKGFYVSELSNRNRYSRFCSFPFRSYTCSPATPAAVNIPSKAFLLMLSHGVQCRAHTDTHSHSHFEIVFIRALCVVFFLFSFFAAFFVCCFSSWMWHRVNAISLSEHWIMYMRYMPCKKCLSFTEHEKRK